MSTIISEYHSSIFMACNNKENYLFLYLNTGSGHRTPAAILKKVIEETYGDNVYLENGFSPKQHIAHAFFEMGYHSSSATFPAIYSLTYDLSSLMPVMKILSFFTSLYTKYHIANLIKEYNITKILSFHFALTPSAAAAIKLTKRKIPLITDITDPYSAHPSWYLEKSSTFIVHSKELENHILNNHFLDKNQIILKPFIFDKKFNADYTESDISELKDKHHIPHNDKVILIAGGGEGLPGVINLVTQFSLSKDITESVSIIVVCGHNASSRTILEGLSIINPRIKLNVLGYVNCMDELIKLSDCIITKAGASMLMQVMACKKPVIFSMFMHGQELGNVQFAINNKVGWLFTKPADILKQALRLCYDTEYKEKIKQNFDRLNIVSNVQVTAEFLHSYKGLS